MSELNILKWDQLELWSPFLQNCIDNFSLSLVQLCSSLCTCRIIDDKQSETQKIEPDEWQNLNADTLCILFFWLDREDRLERGLESEIRFTRQGAPFASGSTNGASSAGSVDLFERKRISNGNPPAFGERARSKRCRASRWPRKHAPRFHQSYTSVDRFSDLADHFHRHDMLR